MSLHEIARKQIKRPDASQTSSSGNRGQENHSLFGCSAFQIDTIERQREKKISPSQLPKKVRNSSMELL